MSITAEQIEVLKGFETATIATAISKLGLRSPTTGFASAKLGCQFSTLPPTVGIAVTCREDTSSPLSAPGTSDAELFKLVAGQTLPAVVLTQSMGHDRMRNCHLGDGMAAVMQRLGAVGFITDGAIRDLEGIRSNVPGFQVFASGVVPSSGQPNMIDVGQPINIFGLTVRTGDLIHADNGGALTVPLDHVQEIIDRAHEVLEFEQKRMDFLQGSDFSLEEFLIRYP